MDFRDLGHHCSCHYCIRGMDRSTTNEEKSVYITTDTTSDLGRRVLLLLSENQDQSVIPRASSPAQVGVEMPKPTEPSVR